MSSYAASSTDTSTHPPMAPIQPATTPMAEPVSIRSASIDGLRCSLSAQGAALIVADWERPHGEAAREVLHNLRDDGEVFFINRASGVKDPSASTTGNPKENQPVVEWSGNSYRVPAPSRSPIAKLLEAQAQPEAQWLSSVMQGHLPRMITPEARAMRDQITLRSDRSRAESRNDTAAMRDQVAVLTDRIRHVETQEAQEAQALRDLATLRQDRQRHQDLVAPIIPPAAKTTVPVQDTLFAVLADIEKASPPQSMPARADSTVQPEPLMTTGAIE